MPNDVRDTRKNVGEDGGLARKDVNVNAKSAEAGAAASNLDAPIRRHTQVHYPPPNDGSVRIRLTKVGLLFSGKSAFISNHYERYFVYEDVGHKTVDHGYCFKKAICYKRLDLADKVRGAETALDAKDVVRKLGKNPEWERVKAPTLGGLFEAKLKQHPDLMEGLLSTAPHRLIEASWDTLWGGGGPLRIREI